MAYENWLRKPSAVQVSSVPIAQTRLDVSLGSKKVLEAIVAEKMMSATLKPIRRRVYVVHFRDALVLWADASIVVLPNILNREEHIGTIDITFS
jgi:hypothetical protein